MAAIKPFKAIRPTKDKASLVVSRSYQSYTRKELNSILAYNPYSFLQIINPGYKFTKQLNGQTRHQMVHGRYMTFLAENILLKDAKDSLYLYQVQGKHVNCCGLFCGTSVEDYRNNVIKKHEDTIQKREVLFASYLDTVKFNAEPVLMTYADNDDIAMLFGKEREREPDYHFSTTDKVSHRLWVISDQNTIFLIQQAFDKIDALYIADGHHRSASSNLYAEISERNNPTHTGEEPYNFFMSYLIPESEIRIFEFNRMVKDLNGHTKESFITSLEAFYHLENLRGKVYRPERKHHFSMYLEGEFYALQLKETTYEITDALSNLDTQILFKTILEPLLGIRDLRNDKRIQYGYGKHNAIEMKQEIDRGKFKVGFGLMAIGIDEIKAIADAGFVMPPKSTYIEPKLRSGFAIYEL